MYRIAVDVVTGFLGSGKTTLLRRLAASSFGRNVALIVNELGEVDVDGRVLGLSSIEKAIELPGGCICCEIDERRFEAALAELVAVRAPDLVVLETSGAAEPGPVLERVRAAGLTIDAVTTVVDAANAHQTLATHALARDQVAVADFVVVNKCDLVSAEDADALSATVAAINPRARVYRAERCTVDLALLFATGVGRYRAGAARPVALHDATHEIAARVFRSRGPLSRDRLLDVLEHLPATVLRAKGLVRVADGAWSLLFNYVCGRTEIEWLPLAIVESQAVVIGTDIDQMWPEIEARFLACVIAPPSCRVADGTSRC